MKAGVARTIITPPVGLELSGWSFGPSVGIHDHLYAKALVIVDRDDPVVFISADLIGLDAEYADRIRSEVATALSTTVERIVVSCSHTHSGPGTMHIRHWGAVDDAYAEVVIRHLIGVARTALRNLEAAAIGFGVVQVPGIALNRRDEGSVDESLSVVKIEDSTGKLRAALWNFSCHPVAAHNWENLISADYPGFAAAVVEAAHPGAVALFTLGAAGDINPAEFHHIRHARRYGTMLGGAILTAIGSAEITAELDVAAATEVVDLPVQEFPSVESLRAEIDEHTSRLKELEAQGAPWPKRSNVLIKLDWAKEALAAREAGNVPATRGMVMQCIRLNDTAFVTLPGELFARIGLEVKRRSPFSRTFVIELANGSFCYLPTRDAFERGGYEIDFSAKVYGLYMLTSEAEELIVEAAARLFARVE